MTYRIEYLIILLIASLLCSCIGSHHQPYPSDWPQRSAIRKDCEKISGIYNAKPSNYGYGEANVWNFLWPDRLTAFNDIKRNVSALNEISILFDSANYLNISYLIDRKTVASKSIVSSEYSCEQGIVRFTKSSRTGKQIYDKIPNYGTSTVYLELFRIDDYYLYAKELHKSQAASYYFIPMYFNDSNSLWYRFAISQPR